MVHTAQRVHASATCVLLSESVLLLVIGLSGMTLSFSSCEDTEEKLFELFDFLCSCSCFSSAASLALGTSSASTSASAPSKSASDTSTAVV
ncbi:hypothetical protein NM688_g9337 [Phlebia brevispora]|uniref:Uncharacterized protein n=1 Tax=Phlebia brevispora TaxID=194682 RepID=A0ACC1RL19_9APHY|nr:hypothetical protein NM688_g9337 [Phlebia brevispora]